MKHSYFWILALCFVALLIIDQCQIKKQGELIEEQKIHIELLNEKIEAKDEYIKQLEELK